MATTSIKMRVPRPLEKLETAESLGQWKNLFTNYTQRDPIFAPFLTCKWRREQPNFGFRDITDGLTAVEQKANCELFLCHISSFLKEPFWNNKILKRTSDLHDVWIIFDEIFNIEHNADSLLDISAMKYDSSESYSSFLARIQFHLENHLPPPDVTVDNISSGAEGESMSIMVMDLAVKEWLEKIHPSLIDRVKIEYGVQIKEGTRLSALAPQIGKAIPSLLKKINNTRTDVVRALQEIGQDTSENNTPVYNMRGGYTASYRSRGSFRGSSRTRGRGGSVSGRGRTSRPTCRHCKWLADHWDIKEIDYNHDSKSCRRTMPSEVRLLQDGDEEEPWAALDGDDVLDEEEEDYIDGSPTYVMVQKDNCLIFQKAEESTQRVDVSGDINNLKQTPAVKQPLSVSQPNSVSEKGLEYLQSRTISMISQMTSPKIRVTYNHSQAVMAIDEGSELNAVSDDYALKHDITLKSSSRKATAAGNNRLEIVGESLNDFVVDTKFGSKRYSLNLGKVSVIANLGCPIIMGEPGKYQNDLLEKSDMTKNFIRISSGNK